MKRYFLTAAVLMLLFLAQVFALHRADRSRTDFAADGATASVMPSKFLKVASLDYDGLASDLLFLKALVHIGSVVEKHGSPKKITQDEWSWILTLFHAATDLDPYFYDPYYIANAYLTWDAGMIRETNALLEKGSLKRDWDWVLPFFMGFNSFYFLHDNSKAAEYLLAASQRPGASQSLATAAVKLASQGRRTENTIYFLEELLRKTEDEMIRSRIEIRLKSVRDMLLMEQAVESFRKRYHTLPQNPDDLVKKGFLGSIPQDPYGGVYYFDPNGGVRSTSELTMEAPRQ